MTADVIDMNEWKRRRFLRELALGEFEVVVEPWPDEAEWEIEFIVETPRDD